MMRPRMTGVREVRSCADLRRFIKYLFAKYRKDPRRVPPLLLSERASLDPKKNPFYEHARTELLYELYERGMAKGYKRCERSWTLEDNRAINHVIEAGGAKRHKTCRLYQKEI